MIYSSNSIYKTKLALIGCQLCNIILIDFISAGGGGGVHLVLTATKITFLVHVC